MSPSTPRTPDDGTSRAGRTGDVRRPDPARRPQTSRAGRTGDGAGEPPVDSTAGESTAGESTAVDFTKRRDPRSGISRTDTSPSEREPGRHADVATSLRDHRRRRAIAVGSTALLVTVTAALAIGSRQPSTSADAVAAVKVHTTPGEIRLVCPPGPRLQATSSDKQFSAGTGVEAADTVGLAVQASTESLSGQSLSVVVPTSPPTPTTSASPTAPAAPPTPTTAASPTAPTTAALPTAPAAPPAPTTSAVGAPPSSGAPTATSGPSASPGTPGRETPSSGSSGPVAPTVSATEVARPTQTPTVAVPLPSSDASSTMPGFPSSPLGKLMRVQRAGITPTMLSAQPDAGDAALVGGLGVSAATKGDLRGIAAASCSAPQEQTWLVGGRAGPGSGSRLVVTNPSDSPATVDVRLLTPEGVLTPAAGTGLVVPPGAVRELYLRALTLQNQVLAIGVKAQGAPVHAVLVDQLVDGTRPAGVDVVTDSGAATSQVLIGRTGPLDAAILRIAVPGNREANVGFRMEDVDGTFGEPDAVTVPAGSVIDVTLPNGPEAATAVVVEADQPILAGIELTRRAGAARDRSWVASSARLRTPTLVPLPGSSELSTQLLIAPGSAGAAAKPLTIRRFNADGQPMTDITVALKPSGVVPVAAAALAGASAVVIVPNGEPVYASLVLTATGDDGNDTMTSVVAIPPASGAGVAVTLQRAAPGAWP